MPVKLSEMPMLYQPVGPVEQLEADLEMFSDPAQYDQDDPRLQEIVADLRDKLDGRVMASQNREDDPVWNHLVSLTSSEEEAEEAMRGIERRKRARLGLTSE